MFCSTMGTGEPGRGTACSLMAGPSRGAEPRGGRAGQAPRSPSPLPPLRRDRSSSAPRSVQGAHWTPVRRRAARAPPSPDPTRPSPEHTSQPHTRTPRKTASSQRSVPIPAVQTAPQYEHRTTARTGPAGSGPPAQQPPRTDLDAELDRSRRGTRPISVRNSTDLGAEMNRSRRGNEPISTRK